MSPRSLNRSRHNRPPRHIDAWRVVSFGLGGLLLLALGCAHALGSQPAPRPRDACLADASCRAHYEAAKAHYLQGNFGEALQQYKLAYALHALPWMLLNIGRIYHKLGQYPQALRHYQRFVDAVPAPPQDLLKKAGLYRHETEIAWLAQPKSDSAEPLGSDSARASSDEPERVRQARGMSVPPESPEPPPASLQTPVQPVATVVLREPSQRQSLVQWKLEPRRETQPPFRRVWLRRWWFWTTIAAATIGLGVGITAIGLSQSRPPVPPMPQPIPSDAVAIEPQF